MFEKIAQIVERYEEIEQRMASPEVLSDYARLNELAQERSEIEGVVEAYRIYRKRIQELTEAEELAQNSDDDEIALMANEEVIHLTEQITNLEEQMRAYLVPKDPRDDKNVYIEIRAGAGGDEAAIFAADLLRMYSRYAELRSWKTDLVDSNEIGVGGYKEVILSLKGRGAFSRLKFESGVHRVQRVPVTESQGRIHTSTATVAVMPEIEDVEIDLDERELEITATFSSGPGGQHMQKNATAIRIVHLPTGITVKVQDQRSQTQNKRLAMAIVQARLQKLEEEKQQAGLAADRRSQVGTGDRSEKIRTYNYPQNRVTDHRINLSVYNLQTVVDGDLDHFIDALTIADQAQKLGAVMEDEE